MFESLSEPGPSTRVQKGGGGISPPRSLPSPSAQLGMLGLGGHTQPRPPRCRRRRRCRIGANPVGRQVLDSDRPSRSGDQCAARRRPPACRRPPAMQGPGP